MGVLVLDLLLFCLKKRSSYFWPIFPVKNLEAEFSNKLYEKKLNENEICDKKDNEIGKK